MNLKRVQALVHKGLDRLPPQFIRPVNERPENSKAIKGLNLPIISLSHVQPDDVTVHEITSAAKELGFFAIKDHGVSISLIRNPQEVGEEFFELSQKEKEMYANDPSKGKFEGYGTKLTTNVMINLNGLIIFSILWLLMIKLVMIFGLNIHLYIVLHRKITKEYNKEILRITDEILRLLSEGLGLEQNILKTKLGGEDLEVEMKINMYPPCPQPELALGVEPHTDMSAITILLPNHVPGLHIWKDGQWFDVDYVPDALYVHIGDQLEVLSNGKYRSVLHRSVVSKEKRECHGQCFACHQARLSSGLFLSLLMIKTLLNTQPRLMLSFAITRLTSYLSELNSLCTPSLYPR